MSLEIRLINRALRASSSSESQEFKGSNIIEGELVEVAAWLRDDSIGVSSLAEVGIVAAEGASKVSATSGIEETGDRGAVVGISSLFSLSFFSLSPCSAATTSSSSSSSCSFLVFSSSCFPTPYKHKIES